MKKLLPILWLLVFSTPSIYAQEKEKFNFKNAFIDSVDHAFDISEWFLTFNGGFPIITVITEPALDYGIGGGLVFIQRSKKYPKQPPTIIALGGLYGFNKSWSAGGFYDASFLDDKIRYRLGIGYYDINLAHFRTPKLPNGPSKLAFNITGWGIANDLTFKISKKNLFLGIFYAYSSNDVQFNRPSFFEDFPIEIKEWELNSSIGALGPNFIVDQRDFKTTPNKGFKSQIIYTIHDEWLGGSTKFHRIDSYWVGFTDFIPKFVMGLRADLRTVWGEIPFYAKPFVNMRGVPAMRYQGDWVLLLETEERWDFAKRWALVPFGGAGKAFNGFDNFNETEWAWSAGLGFRYLIARVLNSYAGLDFSLSDDGFNFQIQFGHYWNGL